MLKRWLLRILFLLPILLSAAGWVESYGHQDACNYFTPEHDYYVESKGGCVHVGCFTAATIFDPAILGWHHFRGPLPETDRDILLPDGYYGERLFWGFGCAYRHPIIGLYDTFLCVPYYFLLLLSTLAALLVWRKTRPRPILRAFPIEVKTP